VSYIASAEETERARVIDEVNELLDTDPQLAGADVFLMPYRTDVFWCVRR
jgi:hypothetical protein